MSTPPGERVHPRVETGERCWIESDSVTLYARLGNISVGGVFVRTSTPIPEGTTLRLRWSLEAREVDLEAEAVVAWVRPVSVGATVPAGMGLRFEPLDPTLADQIDAFVSGRIVA